METTESTHCHRISAATNQRQPPVAQRQCGFGFFSLSFRGSSQSVGLDRAAFHSKFPRFLAALEASVASDLRLELRSASFSSFGSNFPVCFLAALEASVASDLRLELRSASFSSFGSNFPVFFSK
jgi:hypothetical protein